MKLLTRNFALVLFVLVMPVQGFATDINATLPSLNNVLFADSDACRSCLEGEGCDRENRQCDNACKSKIFTNDDDLANCGTNCVSKWASCDSKARSTCNEYCSSDS